MGLQFALTRYGVWPFDPDCGPGQTQPQLVASDIEKKVSSQEDAERASHVTEKDSRNPFAWLSLSSWFLTFILSLLAIAG